MEKPGPSRHVGRLVDIEASNARLDARPATPKYRGGTTSPPVGGVGPPDGGPLPIATHFASADWSLAEAARKKEIFIALRRQLDYEVASGKLVNAMDVEAAVRTNYRTTAQKILQIPSKVAPRVAAMKTAAEVEDLLHREFVKALNALSDEAAERMRKLEAQ
jgi:hypothetical protein